MSGWPTGTMRAAAIVAPSETRLVGVAIPEEAPGTTLVRTAYVGMCGTDVELLHGTASYLRDGRACYPLVFGHEWSGTVAAGGGEAGGLQVGDRVVGQTMVACGMCRQCRNHRPQLCVKLVEIGLYGIQGAAAEYVRVPTRSLVRVPDRVPLLHAVLVEPAVTVVAALERTRCSFRDQIAVIGTGTIGLLSVQLSRLLGASVDAIGVDRNGLRLAEKLGARATYLPEQAAPGRYSLVIEASGSPAGFVRGLDLVEPGGRLAAIGVSNEAATIVPGTLTLKGITVHGIQHGLAFYDATLELLDSDRLDAAALIARVLPLAEVGAAFDYLQHERAGAPKVVLDLSGDAGPNGGR